MKQRLESKGMKFDARQVPGGDLWQIFVDDPNGVMIELNYEAAKEQALAPAERADDIGAEPVGGDANARYRFRVPDRSIGRESGMSRRCALSVTQQQVLDALAKVMSPRGVALTNANVLSADHGQRRQGVLLDQCRCRGGARLGKRARRRPKLPCAPFPASPPPWSR